MQMSPASARVAAPPAPSSLTYVEARAAALSGDHSRSAKLFAALAQQSGDEALRRQAVTSAIAAGDIPLALSLARSVPVARLPLEARLLLIGEELRKRRNNDAIALTEVPNAGVNLNFLGPFVRSWTAAERKDLGGALGALDSMPANGFLAPYREQQRALILLKLKRAADALPYVDRSLGEGGIRGQRLRLALADGLARAGDRARALSIVQSMELDGLSAKERLERRGRLDLGITNASEAFSDMIMAIAVDLGRDADTELQVRLLQVARASDPDNSSAALLLGYFLTREGRTDDGLATLRTVPDDDLFAADARQLQARVLSDARRNAEALTLASGLTARRNATPDDYQTLAAILGKAGRNVEAADAYARAIALATPAAGPDALWPMYLNRASALQRAGKWAEAKKVLEAALLIAPDEPLLLNNLGYSSLEKGEDLERAEALIRKAVALAPNDASITDSLGWALFKRGKVHDAIDTLQQAALKNPSEPEIREHLGDALFTAGRRYEARFAWSAALVTADEEVAARIKSKLDAGLTPVTAAP
ncbi:MAG: tetratricopeptide repeat protein [Sphingomicrobium sp.]